MGDALPWTRVTYEPSYSKAVICLQTDREELMAVYDFPVSFRLHPQIEQGTPLQANPWIPARLRQTVLFKFIGTSEFRHEKLNDACTEHLVFRF